MANKKTLAVELGKMALLHHRTMSPIELEALTSIWDPLCLPLSDEQLRLACQKHSASSAQFPLPVHILQAHRELEARKVTDTGPVYEPISEHHAQQNLVCLAMLTYATLSGDPKGLAKRFFSMGEEWNIRDALAKEILGPKYPHVKTVRPSTGHCAD